MFSIKFRVHFIIILAFLLTFSILHADEIKTDYKSYKSNQNKKEYFEITFDKNWFEITAEIDEKYKTTRFRTEDLTIENNVVKISNSTFATEEGMFISGVLFDYENIHSSLIDIYDDYTLISFIQHTGSPNRVARFKRGNIMKPMSDITVDVDQFVRGMIFTVKGDVHIYGEVNKDIVSLFGDITIHDGSFIRGDIVTITGEINLSDNASVYGEVISGSESDKKRRKKWQKTNEVKVDIEGHYNRVDGFNPMLTVKYKDLDTLLPEVYASIGYAFEAERYRYDIGFKQSILRSPYIAFGGEYYRHLSSDDDWLLSRKENNVFAFFIRQDYKDYYEAEGGTVFTQIKPIDDLDVSFSYRHEETKWFDHHPKLWSLFGGQDKFDQNFASVNPLERSAGILAIDTGTIATISTSVKFDNRDESDPFLKSAWLIKGDFEYSDSSINSDFSYKRYRVSAVRYQKLHQRLVLMVRGMYGWSDETLPMHRKFYLGGLGTVRGYDHKELSGKKFWMMNMEYLIKTPQPGISVSLLWDVARITENDSFSDQDDIKQSLGFALYLGNDFRISLAKRLDRSFDDNPKFNVRLAHIF